MKALNTYNKYMAVIGLLSVMFLSGCATTYRIEPELVSKFKPASMPSEDQTFVYIIRGWAFAGGGSGIWVAANNNVVAVLENGTHTLIKLDAGINSINLVHHRVGFGYKSLDYLPGKTVYYHYRFGKKLERVGRELGISMLMKTKRSEKVGLLRNNDGWDNLLISPALLNFPTMVEVKERIESDENHAVINFLRLGDQIKEVPFGVWSKNGYEGSLKGGEYFQVSVKPGIHTFISTSEHFSVLKADVEAGKEYFVRFQVGMGWNEAHIKILPLDAKENASDINNWMSSLKLKKLNEMVINRPEVRSRLDWGEKLISKKMQEVDSGKLNKRSLMKEHGR